MCLNRVKRKRLKQALGREGIVNAANLNYATWEHRSINNGMVRMGEI